MENSQLEEPERYEDIRRVAEVRELLDRECPLSYTRPYRGTPSYIADVPFDAAGAAAMLKASRVDQIGRPEELEDVEELMCGDCEELRAKCVCPLLCHGCGKMVTPGEALQVRREGGGVSYSAEYWSEGPHVKEFGTIAALASWVQFNNLQCGYAAPQRFGWFRARHSDGSDLTEAEYSEILRPMATVSVFPPEYRSDMKVLNLLPWEESEVTNEKP